MQFFSLNIFFKRKPNNIYFFNTGIKSKMLGLSDIFDIGVDYIGTIEAIAPCYQKMDPKVSYFCWITMHIILPHDTYEKLASMCILFFSLVNKSPSTVVLVQEHHKWLGIRVFYWVIMINKVTFCNAHLYFLPNIIAGLIEV